MTQFKVGDTVRVEVSPGYSKRGVYGISVMYTTHPEARFQGAIGAITDINPKGLYSTPQYLVDFRGFDNSRLGIPWQAQWFREEWLELVPASESTAVPNRAAPAPAPSS